MQNTEMTIERAVKVIESQRDHYKGVLGSWPDSDIAWRTLKSAVFVQQTTKQNRTFRLNSTETEKLSELSKKTGINESELVRLMIQHVDVSVIMSWS